MPYKPQGEGAPFADGISTLGNTLGTTGTVNKQVVLVGGNNVTLSQSADADFRSATITISAGVPGVFSAGISTLGNTSGTTGLVSQEVVFVGGNNVTLSQSINVQSATITVSALQPAVNLAAGTQTATSGTVVISNSNNITFGMSNSSVVTASFSQSIQPTINAAAGTQTATSGTVVWSNSNNVTFGMSNSSIITASATFPSLSAGVSTLGNTAGSTGTVSNQIVFVGGNNITLSQSTGGASSATITISAFNQTVQTQSTHVHIISGNTTGTTASMSTGTILLAGGNNITLSQNANSVTISAFNQSIQTQNRFNLTLSGNTSGALQEVSSGTLTLAGGNNITLSQNANAITISGGAGAAIGIAAGTQTATSGTVVFSNSNNITFGMSNSSVVTVSFSQSIQTQSIINDVNIIGNTSGTTANITSGTLFLAGGNNITLSQNGNSVTISAAGAGFRGGVSNIGNTSGTTGTVNGGVGAGAGLILVSDHIVTGNVSATTFTGANTSDIEYLFHFQIVNRGTQQGTYSIMYNGITGGITRQYNGARSGTRDSDQDNTPLAFAQSTALAAHGYISMMLYTNTLAMIAKILDVRGAGATFNLFEQAILQTHTDATNVTAIVINAGIASGIGSDSRIIWYKRG